jgi:hypothetical protein
MVLAADYDHKRGIYKVNFGSAVRMWGQWGLSVHYDMSCILLVTEKNFTGFSDQTVH